MATCRPLLHQITPTVGCQYSVSYGQHHISSEYASIHSLQGPISSQVPHCIATLQPLQVRSRCGHGSQSNKVLPFKGNPSCSAYRRQECSQNIQQTSTCEPWRMVSHGCCGLGASIYGSFISDEHTKLTTGYGTRGSDDTGLHASTPIEISSGKNFALDRDTVGNSLSRR